MKKLTNKGMLGGTEIALIVVLVGIIGFTGWRVMQINQQESERLSAADETREEFSDKDSDLSQIDVTEEKETEAEEKTEEKDTAPVETEKKETAPEETKTKPTYIAFNKGGFGQEGSVVNVSASLESAQTGTCHFKFKKDGAEKVYVTSQIENAKPCETSVPVSEFSMSGVWNFSVWFQSSDKTVEAYQDVQEIEITL